MLFVNGYKVTPTVFPDKTSQIWKLSEDLITADRISVDRNITWDFEGEHEFIQLVQLAFLLEKLNGVKSLILDCPFLIYGRQDKEVSNESCFALEAFCTIMGGIKELRTFDAHNPAFFKDKNKCPFKFTNTLPYKEINKIIECSSIDLIVYPDKGATTRYPHLSATESVAAEKVRDQLTGEITGMTIPTIKERLSILVVDDLCDGGRTFVELAKLILPYKPSNFVLYVSHGIFSKGTKCLFDAGYKKVYTRHGEVFSDFKMDW